MTTAEDRLELLRLSSEAASRLRAALARWERYHTPTAAAVLADAREQMRQIEAMRERIETR